MRRPWACGILLGFLISSGGCFEIKEDGLDRETSDLNVLKVDGKEVTSMRIARTVPLILQWDETFDVGADPGTPVG